MPIMNETPDDKPAGETDKQPSVEATRESPQPSSDHNQGHDTNPKKPRRPQVQQKKSPKPKQVQKKAQRKAQRKAMPQQTLAYIIFGLGAFAFLGVGILVYQTYMGPSSSPETRQQVSASLSDPAESQRPGAYNKDFGKSNQISGAGTTFADLKVPLEQSKEALPTKESIKPKKSVRKRHIAGSWSASLREAQAILWVDGDSYQLIIDFDYPALASRYSQGTYVLNNGMMLLQPQPEWGKPQNIRLQTDKEYNLLTRNEFSVLLSRKDKVLYWIEPQSNKKHRFFAYRPEGIVQWTKIR